MYTNHTAFIPGTLHRGREDVAIDEGRGPGDGRGPEPVGQQPRRQEQGGRPPAGQPGEAHREAQPGRHHRPHPGKEIMTTTQSDLLFTHFDFAFGT